jgi:DNA-binding MarR family transcriptional regulator
MHESNVIAAWVLATHDGLVAATRGSGLDPRELAALTLVFEHDGCSVDWLCRRVDLTQSGTVRLVDRLVERGLLERGSARGRMIPLHATAAAQARLAAWREARDAAVTRAMSGMSPSERRRLVDALAGALEAQERTRPQADATCRTCTWASCGGDCPVDRSVPGAT